MPGTRPGRGYSGRWEELSTSGRGRLFRAEALAGADQALLRQVDGFCAVGDGIADDPGVPPVTLQDREGGVGVVVGEDHAEADPHIVDLVHLGPLDRGMLLD